MELIEIDESTEDTFYRCLHDEVPADPRVIKMWRAWRTAFKPKGHRAKVLKDDQGQVVGLTNYIPVAHSPYEGSNLMAILCMWIHGYEHLVGNQEARGYGRFMLEQIEVDARESGHDGLVVWAKDYEAWNPVRFYEHMGFVRADQNGLDVLAWKAFNEQAEAPRFLSQSPLSAAEDSKDGRVQVTSFNNGWCGGGCSLCVMARDAASDLEDKVVLTEVVAWEKRDMRARGESIDMLYVDGQAFRPDDPPASEAEFKQALLDRYRHRQRAPAQDARD